MTWLVDDSTGQRLHILMYHSNYQRKFTNRYSSYTFETKSFRYGLDANYNIFFGRSELLLGAGAIIPRFFGDPFKGKPYIPSQNAYASYRLPVDSLFQLRAAAQVVHVKDFNPQLIPSIGIDLLISENQSASVDLTIGKRLPTAVERFFDFDTLYGNPDLEPETYTTVYGRYTWDDRERWSLTVHGGYHRIENEIIWQDPMFMNGQTRDFIFLGLESSVSWWKLTASISGQHTLADLNLTPRSSLWGSLHFQDVFLDGALVLDAIGTASFYDRHQQIRYQPRLDRFYAGNGRTDGYLTFNWRIVATIHNAHLFIEMENAFSEDYEIVYGYFEFYRRLRFGVNWILWD
jgi:outer membrane cobalamin receptor